MAVMTDTAGEWLAAYRGAAITGTRFPRQAGRVLVRYLWTCAVCGQVIPKGGRVLGLDLTLRERRLLCLECEGQEEQEGGRT